jgi:NADH dehydrogenase
MAVIGRAAAVANIFGLQISGLLAWLIWLFVHLIYIVEFQSRVMVFMQWGFEYLTFSRGARLITGAAATDVVGGKRLVTAESSFEAEHPAKRE